MSCREGRADPEMHSAKRTTLCRALQSWFVALLYHTEMHWVNTLLWPLNRKFSGLLVRPWISSAVADGTVFGLAFLTCVWMCAVQVRSRRCLHRGTWSCSPSPQGPADHKRSVGPCLFLKSTISSLVYSRSERDSCPWHHDCKSLYLTQVCGLIIVGNEAQNHSIISKFNNRSGAVRGHTVVCVERVEQGLRTQPCGAPTFRVMELEVNWPISPLVVCRWGSLESSHSIIIIIIIFN